MKVFLVLGSARDFRGRAGKTSGRVIRLYRLEGQIVSYEVIVRGPLWADRPPEHPDGVFILHVRFQSMNGNKVWIYVEGDFLINVSQRAACVSLLLLQKPETLKRRFCWLSGRVGFLPARTSAICHCDLCAINRRFILNESFRHDRRHGRLIVCISSPFIILFSRSSDLPCIDPRLITSFQRRERRRFMFLVSLVN